MGEDVCTLRGKIDSEDKKGDDSSRDRNNATVHLEDDRNGFLLCGLLSKGASVVPSTRLTATMAVVLTWLHEVPDDKILSKCPSQHVTLLAIPDLLIYSWP